MTTVVFACIHNAGRSQMAAALFNLVCDPAKARAISAGTNPGPRVHPEVHLPKCCTFASLSTTSGDLSALSIAFDNASTTGCGVALMATMPYHESPPVLP